MRRHGCAEKYLYNLREVFGVGVNKMQKIWDRILNSYSINGQAVQTLAHFKTFLKTYRFLKKSQWWSQEQFEAYQLQQLHRLIHNAYKNVPYYRKIFDERSLTPKDIKHFEDLQKLPFLTKDIVREHIKDLKATNCPEYKFEFNRTGGSTGFPLQFYKEKGVWMARHMAYTKAIMDWTGCSFLDRSVFITHLEEPWKYQLFGRVLVLSSFYMNEDYIPQFIQKISKLKPKYILTYPSTITILAQYMKKNNIKAFSTIEAIICHAETIYDWQRDIVEEIFNCRVHDSYGQREQTVFGGTCEYSNCYHMFPQYGIFELIDKNGKPVTKEDKIGEIVGTGFHTYFFPFIRYKTGDLGVYTKKKCECGRNYPLLKKIEGRVQDFVVSKNKKIIPFTEVHHLVVDSSQQVKESQFYQDKEGELVLNIVKTQQYTESDSQAIQKNFQKILDNEFHLSICFVDHIPRTKRGKFQFLIQKLPIEFGPTLNS